MPKKISKKLALKKTSIAALDEQESKKIYGGFTVPYCSLPCVSRLCPTRICPPKTFDIVCGTSRIYC